MTWNRFQKRKKYNNSSCRCLLDHRHDSRGEANYCNELQMLKKAKEIKDFEIQKTFDFVIDRHKICSHRVDFLVTMPDESQEVREYKGFTTDTWIIKKKLFEALYPWIKYVVVWHR